MPTAQWEPPEARARARPATAAVVVAVLVLLGVGIALAGSWASGGSNGDELAIDTGDADADASTGEGPPDEPDLPDWAEQQDDPTSDPEASEPTEPHDAEEADPPGPGPSAIPEPVGEWVLMAESPLSARADSVAVWTGEHVLVWGGVRSERRDESGEDGTHSSAQVFVPLIDGARYDPAEDAWHPIPDAPLEQPRLGATSGVWTGDELVVLSGAGAAGYDPRADRWRELSDPPEGVWRWGTAVWTGEAVAVLGERDDEPAAIAYDPGADHWRELAPPPILDSRVTGLNGRVVIYGHWGDESGLGFATTAYDPDEDRWSQPERIPIHPHVSVGIRAITSDPVRDRVILLGARGDDMPPDETWAPYVATWLPDANRGWRTLPRHAPPDDLPLPIELTALRQGTLAWLDGLGTGRLFSYEGWRPLAPYPLGDRSHSAVVWTGSELVVWGGFSRADDFRADGARWRPGEDAPPAGPAPLEPPTRGEWPFQAEPD